MAQSALMKQGLEGLFNPKNQFESEADYGKKILKVAWTVEILAALTGLFIAWGQGYDVYNSIENPTTSHLGKFEQRIWTVANELGIKFFWFDGKNLRSK